MSQLSQFPFDELVIRRNLKSAESSTTIAAGKLAYIDAAAGTIKLAGADDPLGPNGLAETDILPGKSGFVLFRGYPRAGLVDTSGFSVGDILSPSTSGAMAATATGDQKKRVAQVITAHATTGTLYFNGFNL